MNIEYNEISNSISGKDREGREFHLHCNNKSEGYLSSKKRGDLDKAERTLDDIKKILDELAIVGL